MKKIFELINRNITSDEIAELLGSAKNGRKNLPLITVSREMGSGGRPIAELVGKKLGKPWIVYHREIVEDMARESKIQKKLIREIDEHAFPIIEEIIADFFGTRYLNLGSYYRHLLKILSAVGTRGNAVIVGRGAHHLFPHALKVRIICEMEQRIRWMMEFEKLTRAEAVKRIEESDLKRIEFEKTLYNHDPRKAHHYDLIVRTGPHLTIDDAAEMIVVMAKRKFGKKNK